MQAIAARLRARRPRAGRATAAEETAEEEDSRPIDITDLADFEDVKPVESLPSRPFPFMAFLIRHHFLKNTLFIVATVVAATATDSINPYVLGQIVNGIKDFAGKGLTAWPHDLTLLLIVIGLLWSGGQILYRIWEYIDLHTTPKMRALSQRYMFGYLLGHSHRFFQDNFAGKIGQRVKQGSQATMALMQVMCFDLVRLITLMLVACTLLFRARPDYAFILLGWTALYLSVSYFLARRCVKLSSHLSDEMSTVTGRLIDAVTNADLIRAFAKSVFEKNFLVRYLKREMNASQRLRWFLILMRQWMSLATIALIMTLIVVSARGVVAGKITIGDFTMIYMLSNMVAMNVQNLSYQMLNFFQQFGTLSDALDLLTHEHEIPDAPNAQPLKVNRGGIRLENITFHHNDGSKLFDRLNIDIKPGEKIGLVGHSGAGKSTLVKLIRRQYAPLGGRILIDGQDIALVTSDSLNDAIAEVPQSAGIFHRSIRENVRYHNPTASEEEVIHAAKLAHAHEFIMSRPTGYGTVVGEQGIKLSGGERQRVAIARAFLKNAKILILDEATSSLDSESEHLIQSALFKLMEGRTVIAIAHRLSTIVGMDRILYMENGRIIEEGSHNELVARRGAYARLWERQVSGFEAA